MSKDYIPKSDTDLAAFGRQVYDYAETNAVRWGVTPPGDLRNSRLEQYQTLVERCQLPTKNKVDVTEKNGLKKQVVTDLRTYIQGFLAKNPAVSNTDREMMRLPIYDTEPTPVEAPKIRATARIAYRGAGSLELHIAPDGDISADKKAYYGCKIQYEVIPLDAPPPQGVNDLNESRFTRRKKEPFVFQPEQSGKRAWFALRYENSKGQAGPWCQMFSAIIP